MKVMKFRSDAIEISLIGSEIDEMRDEMNKKSHVPFQITLQTCRLTRTPFADRLKPKVKRTTFRPIVQTYRQIMSQQTLQSERASTNAGASQYCYMKIIH